MKKTLSTIIAGAMLSGCVAGKSLIKQHDYKDDVKKSHVAYMAQPAEYQLVMQYDLDGDEVADVQHGYIILGYQPPFMKLMYAGRWEDKDKNHQFDQYEFEPTPEFEKFLKDKGV